MALVQVAFGLFGLITVPVSAHAQAGGKLVPLYQFTGKADGGEPLGGVVRDAGGVLYGTTDLGGTGVCTSKIGNPTLGCGTIYSYSKATGLKVLANFTGANGAHPQGTLTLVGSTLYGTTANGGASDLGVIFSIGTDGSKFTLLHQFDGTDGKLPSPQLRAGEGSLLYGLTPFGGTSNDGVLFSISPSGTYTVLHDFAGGSDAEEPFTLLVTDTGTLLGSSFLGGGSNKGCSDGCGTLFEYHPASGQYTVPYSYTTSGGAGGVIGGIAPGETVYGASEYYVYTISSNGGFVDRGDFSILEVGNVTSSPLLAPDGSLIGVNSSGPDQGFGTIYSAAQGVIRSLTEFGGAAGYGPYSQPILLPGKRLIGTNSAGGLCTNCGTIWAYLPP